MILRLLPVLVSLCLLASLNGIGLHVHWHSHGQEQAHSHVVSVLDADHIQTHVQGSQDEEDSRLGARSGPELPQIALVSTAPLPVAPVGAPGLLPLQAEQRVTGPPGYLKPPSQAPPRESLIV